MSHKIENEELMLINKYKLQPHPEGGYFSQIYKSADTVKPLDCRYHNEQRSASTSIYYLLEKNDYSAWHRLNSDELWHFYKGSPLSIYVIDKCGTLSSHLLGDPLITSNANFQVCIKAGNYFAAKNTDKSSYSFVSCTVSPGFEYTDFELADKNELIDNFPQHESTIKRFARQM
ncbi:MAG: hypothetical protein A3F13_04900 [Gammaproteobacteria bacterium RIFCSPHIGHO2_12_FULL_40_19]|nr:MAG: hypothetical protein A3F13_04900 [Gammaproteobacteria bacterium RIFCSPHIGHO2_12_FULL_40_19]